MISVLTVFVFDDYLVAAVQTDNGRLKFLSIDGQDKPWLYFYKDKHKFVNNLQAKERYDSKAPKAFVAYELAADPDATKAFLAMLVKLVRGAFLSFFEIDTLDDDVPVNLCFLPEFPKSAATLI